MNFAELINQNISKKMGIAIVGAILLHQASAPSWQIMTVIVTAVIVQGILDYVQERRPPKKD